VTQVEGASTYIHEHCLAELIMTRKEHQTRRTILKRIEGELYGTAAHAADQTDRGYANLGGQKIVHYRDARKLLARAHALCGKVLRLLKG
jgi:hypothetical protein